ncbi:MAG: peptide-methionine (S)-S-oxide reductase [Ignavibacteriae bacterium]|nr:MAG: peptide-methionine (S)-S-oxide reductase [Ignavibacteriota bacterium]
MNLLKFVVLLSLTLFTFSCSKDIKPENTLNTKTQKDTIMPEKLDTAVFGAGCFWCVEAIFQRLKGVYSVESGYAGGNVPNPSYELVCTGTTGHAEVARITYDPAVISFEEILEVFWTTHDPTTLNRQGADVGTQYRSVIFYQNEEQKKSSERSKIEVASKLWDDPVVTEISPLTNFYKAEDYHQNYYNNNPNQGYCLAVINPKVTKFKKKFANRLKEEKAIEN